MLRLTAEQEQLCQSVHRFFAEHSPEAAVRAQMDSERGYDLQLWSRMARDLGLQAILVPERFGGIGMGYTDVCLVFEEMGEALVCAPFFSTVALATNVLLALDDEPALADFLPGIAAGDTVATLALIDGGEPWDADAIVTRAAGTDGDWRLTGVKRFVTDGLHADLILVVARAADGIGIYAVTAKSPGLSRRALTTMDATRKLADLAFDGVPARRIGSGDNWPAIAHAIDLAIVALVAEQIGGMRRLLAMSTDYARTRIQFGRAIGSFQAIKHKCADMLLDLESAKAIAHAAYRAADSDENQLAACASMAKAYCSEAYFNAAAANIQIHGGIGFTWEYPAQLYFKRAKSLEMLLGTPDTHRERYLAASGF